MVAAPGKPEVLPNGAVIAWDHLLRKYAVFDGFGDLAGYRYTMERAREFAASLPAGPPPSIPPRPVSRSPRALPVAPVPSVSAGPEVERTERISPTNPMLHVAHVPPRKT